MRESPPEVRHGTSRSVDMSALAPDGGVIVKRAGSREAGKVSGRRKYKELTSQQLRSFYESARLGSFSEAARHLGLAHPTVWEQVRALEGHLGKELFESRGRRLHLTAAGKILFELAGPLVLGMASLPQRFEEGTSDHEVRLAVASTPRIVAEDLPESIKTFCNQYPRVRLSLHEVGDEHVTEMVSAGEADLGLTGGRATAASGPWGHSPWLASEPVYELDVVLITPKKHPLARRRSIRPEDLRGYPLVNALDAFPDPAVMAVLDKADVLLDHQHRISAFFATTTCRYVELGFGIGLVVAQPHKKPRPNLHERVMTRFFGKVKVYAWRRKGAPSDSSTDAFLATVRSALNPTGGGSR
jgi:DNA-binding transcriptional LysR family regulator